MKNWHLLCVITLGIQSLCYGIEAQGGVGVTCFDRLKYLNTTVTVDFYKANLKGKFTSAVQEIMHRHENNRQKAYDSIRKLLAESPALDIALEYIHRVPFNGEWLDAGTPAAEGLEFSNDVGVLPRLPSNCKPTQITLRQKDVIFFDPEIYRLMTGFQQALLQVHEELSYLGAQQIPSHQSSVNTQLLLNYILTEANFGMAGAAGKAASKEFYHKLYRYGFLSSEESSEFRKAGEKTNKKGGYVTRSEYITSANSVIKVLEDPIVIQELARYFYASSCDHFFEMGNTKLTQVANDQKPHYAPAASILNSIPETFPLELYFPAVELRSEWGTCAYNDLLSLLRFPGVGDVSSQDIYSYCGRLRTFLEHPPAAIQKINAELNRIRLH